MREIKFRAWSKILLHMYYPEDNVKEPNLWNLKNCVKGGSLIETDYILMQYTGLKDKNGKEIYEGDIIQYRGIERGRKYDCIGDIFWNYSYCGWRIKNSVYMPLPISPWCEVIGNIHENKELLDE